MTSRETQLPKCRNEGSTKPDRIRRIASTTMSVTGSQLVAESLHGLGVEVVFGLVGVPVFEVNMNGLLDCGLTYRSVKRFKHSGSNLLLVEMNKLFRMRHRPMDT